MPAVLDFAGFMRMLRGAARAVEAGHEELSRLDSRGGDGDHGTTMLRAMRGLQRVVSESRSGSVADLLQAVGWEILGIDGGATGPLFGSLFTGMAEAAAGKDAFDAGGLASLFEAGLASVARQTRARVGDKTMMDALIPAVGAMREGADAGEDISGVLRRAAEAAERGAASTELLEARFGRAKNLGPRSVGGRDPGAMSVAILLRGFVESSCEEWKE